MIGTTKLSTMRKKLEKAMGPDPIAELDRQIDNAKRDGLGTEVMEGLKKFLVRARKEMRRKPKARAKKSPAKS
jgi:hypothetical protein